MSSDQANMRTILIVDTAEAVLESVSGAIKANGYHAVTASTPGQALNIMTEQRPDAVLLDMGLPDNGSLDLLSHCRDDVRFRDLPVILLVTSVEQQSVSSALQMGASDYVAKPIDFNLLLARLQTQLDVCDRVRRLELRLQQFQKTEGRDETTGAANRAFAMNVLDSELRRAARYHRPLSLVMMDLEPQGLDRDSKGYESGLNDLLRHAAAVLGFTLRSTDLLARMEDMRFLAILPETTEQQGIRTGERLREALAFSPLRINGLNVSLGLFVGVVSYTGAGMAPTSKDLLSRVRHALERNRLSSNPNVALNHASSSEFARTVITPLED